MTSISCSIAAFLVASTLLLALRPLAVAIGLVDKPGGRKTHHGEIPVIGGISMFAGLVLAGLGGEQLGHHGIALLVAAAFMVFLGVLDDRFGLPPRIRLLAHTSAAAGLVYGTGFQVTDLGNILGTGPVVLGPLALPFTILACVALINAFNMLDGLDGLAGGVALVAFAAVATIAVGAGAPTMLLISSSMVGSLVAFLIFNVPARFNRPVRTFMGDAGSTLLGFMLAGVGLTLIQPTKAAMDPVIILWFTPIPIFELFTTTVRRVLSGVSPTMADSNHSHHKLLNAGFSVRVIFAIYLAVSIGCAAVAVHATRSPVADPLLFARFVAAFVIWTCFVARARWFVRLLPKGLRRDREHLVPYH